MAYGDTALTTQPSGYVQDALNKPFAFSNTQAALNPGQLQQQAADTAYQSATRYLDPQFQRQQSGLENQLANQGITRGSEAWNNAMNQFGENKWFFGVGAMLASVVWFTSVGYGAKAASSLMSKPIFWRVLDTVIAVIMFSIAITLAFYRFS